MGLVVEGLAKAFGAVRALQGISLRVPRGRVVGLIGPNGAGKTTTLRILARILRPDAGRVEWDGHPLDSLPRSLVGYLPEERGLYPSMRVREVLAFFGRLRGLSGRALQAAVDAVVELLELGPLLERPAGTLSRGNAQKVQFAAACLHGPGLLLLDEPFSGLDVEEVRRLSGVLEELKRRGTAVLFSSHQMEHVERLCDAVAIVAGGRVVLAGGVQEVRGSAGERVVRLAWEGVPAEGAARIWLEGLRGRGARVTAQPDGVWELRWAVAACPDPQRLLDEVRRIGPVRRFEVSDPSLEEVYLAAVARTRAASPAEAPGGQPGVGSSP